MCWFTALLFEAAQWEPKQARSISVLLIQFAAKTKRIVPFQVEKELFFSIEIYDFAVMRLNISSEKWELWIAPRRFNFAGADLDKTWQGFLTFFFFFGAMKFAWPTLSMFGLMQRTKKGLEALSVAIREWRESWNRSATRGLRSRLQRRWLFSPNISINQNYTQVNVQYSVTFHHWLLETLLKLKIKYQ